MDTLNKLRIYLLDEHVVVRESFERALRDEPDIVVVGQGSTGADALRETAHLKPDVVVSDLNTPDRDGIDLLGSLRTQLKNTKLLVFSAHDDEYRVTEALRAGAHGYIVKTAPLAEVIDAIRRVAQGGFPLSSRIAGAVVRGMRKQSGTGTGIDALTARERQVLRLLAAGISTRETAARLTISPKTVETHRVRIYAKLGCKSAVELTRIAVRTGLVQA